MQREPFLSKNLFSSLVYLSVMLNYNSSHSSHFYHLRTKSQFIEYFKNKCVLKKNTEFHEVFSLFILNGLNFLKDMVKLSVYNVMHDYSVFFIILGRRLYYHKHLHLTLLHTRILKTYR